MLELHTATIRCQCGYSIRHSGAMVDRPRCPRCGNLPPQDELERFDRQLAAIVDPSLCDHTGLDKLGILRGIEMCCGCEQLITLPAGVTQKCFKGIVVVERSIDERWLAAQPLLYNRASVLIGRNEFRSDGEADDVWEFPDWPTALRVLLTWDGHGEPATWDRHPASGRRHPDGVAPHPELTKFIDVNGGQYFEKASEARRTLILRQQLNARR